MTSAPITRATSLPRRMPRGASWLPLCAALAASAVLAWDRGEQGRDLTLALAIQEDLLPRLTIAHLQPEGRGFTIRLAQVDGMSGNDLLHCLPFEDTHAADDARPPRADRRVLMPGPAVELMMVADSACRRASELRRVVRVSA